VKTKNPEPTCPTCGYDLAGIIREDGTATCPECGQATALDLASIKLNRWPHTIVFIAAVGVIPSALTLFALRLFHNNSVYDFVSSIAVLLLVSQWLAVPLMTLFAISYEAHHRHNDRGTQHMRPSGRMSCTLITLAACVAAVLNIGVFSQWLLAMTSI